jgi:hypothetical protein
MYRKRPSFSFGKTNPLGMDRNVLQVFFAEMEGKRFR